MMARISIDFIENEISEGFNLKGDLLDMRVECRLEKGETFFFSAHGYEWMGECTGVHHLFGIMVAHGDTHLPMFKLTAHAVRKIPA